MLLRVLFSLFIFISAVLGNQAGESACAYLSSKLGADTVQTPSGPGFEISVGTPLNLANDALRPACVVLPRNTSDVSTTMKAIYQTKSKYAVLAGGHSAMKGWNAVEGGVLIHFKNMNEATYDAQKDTITLQPGIRWGKAVSALESLGVVPVGGRAADVGTGFLLGGGIGFPAPSLGFGADSFKELDVVLVNGTVVTATVNNQYQDLFRALKGGANRFGIVTRYEVYPYHSGTKNDKTWFGGFITYSGAYTEAVVRATAHFTRDVKDSHATIFVTLVNNVNSGIVETSSQVNLFYNGTSLPSNVFGEFLSIPATNTSLTPLSYADIALNTFPTQNDHGSTFLYGSSVLTGKDEKPFVDAARYNLNFTEALKRDLAWTALTYTPVPDSQILAGRARGGNAIDAPLTGGYAVLQIMQTLPLGVVNVPQAVTKGKQKLLTQIKPTPGLPLFINECDASQNVFATYGRYEFLKETYRKYDPERFNIEHTDGPIGL